MTDPDVLLDDMYVDPAELVTQMQDCLVLLTRCWIHGGDSDDPQQLGVLLAEVAKVRKSVAEVYQRVEAAFVSCAGEQKLEVPSVGVFEVLRKTKRTGWRNEDLWKQVIESAREQDVEPLVALESCARPSWRMTELRALGIDPGDFCREEPDGWSVKLPARDLEDTF